MGNLIGNSGSREKLRTKRRAEDLSLTKRLGTFAFLMWAEFFYGWSWNTVDILRPQIRESLGLSLTEVGSAYSAQAAGALVGAIIMGQVADRFGRRSALFAIMVGYGTMGIAGVFVTDYYQLLAQRFGLGVALGGIFPVVIAIYMGLFPASWRGKLASVGNATFNLSVISLGASLSLPFAQADWHMLQWIGALPAILSAPLVFLLVPNDRRISAWGVANEAPRNVSKIPVAELFTPQLRRLTLLLALLIGLNFFAYQAFAGWVATYLTEARGFSLAVVGSLISWQFAGSLIGGFFWGWFSDRYGRRRAGIGFVIGVAIIIAYLTLFSAPVALRLAGFAFGFAIAASVAWAPWMSELFPVHLRSTALSVFQWGRIISFFAPLITGAVADSFGVASAMMLAAIAFGAAALVWFSLPETLGQKEMEA